MKLRQTRVGEHCVRRRLAAAKFAHAVAEAKNDLREENASNIDSSGERGVQHRLV